MQKIKKEKLGIFNSNIVIANNYIVSVIYQPVLERIYKDYLI